MERAAGLREALETRGVRWPARLEWNEVLVSTNDVAKERARSGEPEWTAIRPPPELRGRRFSAGTTII